VIGDSVENLIPFGATENAPVVKKDTLEEESGEMPVVDWLGLVFDHNETEVNTPPTTTESQPLTPKLEWLRMILGYQEFLRNGLPTEPTIIPTTTQPTVNRHQQWQDARAISMMLGSPVEDEKRDAYAVEKTKINWTKLMAEPLDNYKQSIPVENHVDDQFQSNELAGDMLEAPAQKRLILPASYMKNKDQWYGENEM
jgi:hypothetical protein